MTTARDYAKALYALPARAKHLPKLREALERRGHQKLLPRIFAEYKKLELSATRRATAVEVTTDTERTRILLELYKKLVAPRD